MSDQRELALLRKNLEMLRSFFGWRSWKALEKKLADRERPVEPKASER